MRHISIVMMLFGTVLLPRRYSGKQYIYIFVIYPYILQIQYMLITFKNNGGRTGNLIFPYMICKLIEIKLKYHKYIPYDKYDMNNSFIITDENIEEILSSSSFFIFILLQNKNIICNGYFQKSIFFMEYRTQLLERMQESIEDYWLLDDRKYYITDFFKETPRFSVTEKDVVVSLRLDDFIQYPCPTSDIIPPQYYLDILDKLEFSRLYIVCDKVKYDWEYRYLEFFKKWNPTFVIGDTLLKDGALMRDCPTLIHSNSTFSWLMSFFSQNSEKKRFIPCTNMYKVQLLEHIDEKDIVNHIKPLTHQEVHDLTK